MRGPEGRRLRLRGLKRARYPTDRAIGQHQHARSVGNGREVFLDTAVRAVVTRMPTRLGGCVVGLQRDELGASRCTNFNPSFTVGGSHP